MDRKDVFRLLFLFIFALNSFAFAEKATSPILDEELLKRIQNEVSGSICFEHVRSLSTLHRIWGSRDYHQAAQYLVDKASLYGLQEAVVEKYRIQTGRENFWMQSTGGYLPWDCRSGELRLVTPYPMLLTNFESAASTVAIGSRATQTTAELIYVGRGDAQDNYQGKDVKGKLVLAEDGRHEKVHELAVHKFGALGTIQFYNDQGPYLESEGIYWGRILPWNKDRTKPSTFGFNLSATQGLFLKNLLLKGEKIVISASVDAKILENGAFELATAIIPGSRFPEEEFIFFAHLDHPKPAAHDNASGDAVLLEIARTLSNLIKNKTIPAPQRTIRFMWIPHMSGLNLFFWHHQEKIGKVKGGCNVDCVGVNQAKFPSKFYVALPPHSLHSILADIACNIVADFNHQIDQAISQGETADLLFSPEGSRNLFSITPVAYQGGSDEYTANTRSLGIPSLYFYDDPLPPRHNQINFLDYIDPTNLGRISYLGAAISYSFASLGEEMASQLLNEASFRGESRLSRELLKAKNLIDRSRPENIHQNFERGSDLLFWGLNREGEIARSLKELVPETKNRHPGLLSYESSLKGIFGAATNELEKRYELRCNSLGLKPRHKASAVPKLPQEKIIPTLKKGIKGSPGYFSNYFEDMLGEDYLKKYKGVRLSFRYGNVGYYETLNFINGQNTIADIYRAVQAELWSEDYPAFHSLTLEETTNYLQMLSDAQVIDLKTK